MKFYTLFGILRQICKLLIVKLNDSPVDVNVKKVVQEGVVAEEQVRSAALVVAV